MKATTPEKNTLAHHLTVLRKRLLACVIVFIITFVALVPFANTLYAWLAAPLIANLPAHKEMIAINLINPLFTPLKLTFYVALFITMPWLLYQLWAFVAPALYHQEKITFVSVLLTSILLFYSGLCFGYFLVFPLVFQFLVSAGPTAVAIMPDIHHYLDFTLTLFFAFGVAFEIPIAIVVLVLTGVTSVKSLGNKRPYLLIVFLTLAMLLTPPDIFSQLLLAAPMYGLFELGLITAYLLARKKNR